MHIQVLMKEIGRRFFFFIMEVVWRGTVMLSDRTWDE